MGFAACATRGMVYDACTWLTQDAAMVSNLAVLVVLVGCLLELAFASKGPAQEVPRDGRLGFPPGMTVGYAGATTDSTHPPRVMLRCYGAACETGGWGSPQVRLPSLRCRGYLG